MNIAKLSVAALLVVAACTSNSDPSPPGNTSSGGDPGPGDPAPGDPSPGDGADKNPYDRPYPKDNIGVTARSGSRRGSTIENFKFIGYPDANVADGMKPISLAQYFDPEGRKYKLIHITAAGTWCGYCQGEARLVADEKANFEAKGIVWLVSLSEGPAAGSASTKQDLENWITDFKGPFTHFLDPKNANLGVFYDRAALPWNANIDAHTMEILTSGTGAPTSKDALWNDLNDALGMIDGSAQ